MLIVLRRAPYGARGLKYRTDGRHAEVAMSRPVWGAWIEILPYLYRGRAALGRAPYGARGLKLLTLSLGTSMKVAPRMGRVD